MNKALFIFAVVCVYVSSSTVQAVDTWKPEGSFVTYGTPGKGLWHIGSNFADPDVSKKQFTGQFNDLYDKKLHPFFWARYSTDEILWHIHGSRDEFNKELFKTELSKGVQDASWIWEDFPKKNPLKIIIGLKRSGFGWVGVHQGNQAVAHFRCVSSKIPFKEGVENCMPKIGEYKIQSKAKKQPQNDNIPSVWSKEHSCWMNYALCVDDGRGIFIHARNISENSHGCIGVSWASVRWLFENVSEGTDVTIGFLE